MYGRNERNAVDPCSKTSIIIIIHCNCHYCTLHPNANGMLVETHDAATISAIRSALGSLLSACQAAAVAVVDVVECSWARGRPRDDAAPAGAASFSKSRTYDMRIAQTLFYPRRMR
eukprot:COSAG02_NODE_68_length_42582_cov_52.351129_44_plen_116_part_00